MNILSFDIEDWFHILDNNSTKTETEWAKYPSRLEQNMELIFELLRKYNIKATFFCLGWIAKTHPETIKSIVNNGYEIGFHSNYHQLIYEQQPDEFEKDLSDGLKILEELTGEKIKSYRAPGFSIKRDNLWAFEILSKYGIEVDSSIFPASRGHGGISDFEESNPHILSINGAQIKELPMNPFYFGKFKLMFAGGGYFRLLPLPLLRRLFKSNDYNMTYFHPRDFDSDQPKIEGLSKYRKFKSYVGLKSSYKKLDKILSENEFIDVRTAVNKIDWTKVNTIEL